MGDPLRIEAPRIAHAVVVDIGRSTDFGQNCNRPQTLDCPSQRSGKAGSRLNDGFLRQLEQGPPVMPSAVFDYDEIRKRLRTDHLFRRETERVTSASAGARSSTVATSVGVLCDWCGKGGGEAARCPHNRNTGVICAIHPSSLRSQSLGRVSSPPRSDRRCLLLALADEGPKDRN